MKSRVVVTLTPKEAEVLVSGAWMLLLEEGEQGTAYSPQDFAALKRALTKLQNARGIE